jgi:hypothetical protein
MLIRLAAIAGLWLAGPMGTFAQGPLPSKAPPARNASIDERGTSAIPRAQPPDARVRFGARAAPTRERPPALPDVDRLCLRGGGDPQQPFARFGSSARRADSNEACSVAQVPATERSPASAPVP